MKLERLSSADAIATACVDRIAAALERDAEAVLLLPAGNTPIPMYRELVARVHAGALDLSRAQLFQLDELVGVGPGDERSFHAFLRRHVLDPLGLDGDRVHLLDGATGDAVREIERHGERLLERSGADLAFLGIGRNGHVAFNEPGSLASDGARVVELAEATLAGLRASFAASELPTLGITLGLRELHAAREVSLVATGASKHAVVERLLEGAPLADVPAAVFADHAGFTLYTDFDVREGA